MGYNEKVDPRCKIGRVTYKQPKTNVVKLETVSGYECAEDVLRFTRDFFDVLRNEPVVSVGIIYETTEGTGQHFVLTPGATYSTLIANCDILKHKIIESYLA